MNFFLKIRKGNKRQAMKKMLNERPDFRIMYKKNLAFFGASPGRKH